MKLHLVSDTCVQVVHKDDHAALANKTHYGQVEANGANKEKNFASV